MQERSFSNPQPHNTEISKFYTPDRQIKGNTDSSFGMSRLKTEKSRYNESSPE